ncbi:MAG: hypothetical protein K5652_06915 [Bacteroidales bacterium]|nr:hypothetical protein [Bacteroidales bacterium]
MKTFKKIVILTIVVLLLVAGGWIFIHFFWTFGTGVKAGELNQVVYKGWIWKTYEGRLIMSGFKNDKKGSGLQSNEFTFSVDKKAEGRKANGAVYSVADSLMRCSGKLVQVKYKEFRGALPWRGMQKFVVFDIINVSDPARVNTIPIDTGE